MKLLKEVEKIFKKKYQPFVMPMDGYSNIYKYIEANPNEKSKYIYPKNDSYFNKKYKQYITTGYYGFSTNSYMPEIWTDIIDDLVELFILNDPSFEIHQIKVKFGGVRFYVVSNVIEDLFEINEFIEGKFYSPYLMY